MTGFVIGSVICVFVVLAIAWGRYRAKKPKQVERKRQITLSGTSDEDSLSRDLPSYTDSCAKQHLNDDTTITRQSSAQMLEALGALGTSAAEDASNVSASPAAEFLPQEVLSEPQAANPSAVGHLQEAAMIGGPLEAPIDRLPVIREVQASSEIVQSQGTEIQVAPDTLLETKSEAVAVPNIEKTLVPEDLEVSQTTSPPPIDDLKTASDETAAREMATRKVDIQNPDTSELLPGINEHENDEVPAAASTPQYQAPRISVVPAKRGKKQTDSRHVRTEQPLSLTVKGRIHKDYWSFSLLAPKPEGSPPELAVRCGTTVAELIEANDDWYEVAVDGLGDWLSGVVMLPKNRLSGTHHWQLTARDCHILASDNAISGWASVTRLVLGRKHLVLCSQQRSEEVAALLREVVCNDAAQLGVDFGAPSGWVLFWPVVPEQSVAPVPGEGVLNLLRPLPDLQISLEGGLPLQSSSWMVGYPPTIRVVGELGGHAIIIDEKVATRAGDGDVVTVGYDAVGEHHISIAGRQSRSYSIVEPELNSEHWNAYEFPMGTICGALVRPIEGWVVTVPASNPLLIGAKPGQIYLCPPQPGLEWTAFPAFEPVWALPADPVRCRKESSHIILLTAHPPEVMSLKVRDKDGHLWRWMDAIRSARRKGLGLKEQTDNGHELWLTYAQSARDLWRRLR